VFFLLNLRLVFVWEVARLSPLVVVVGFAVLLGMENLLHMLVLLFLQLVERVDIGVD
jgi:hypothetical protein